jgi:hypothetical protein
VGSSANADGPSVGAGVEGPHALNMNAAAISTDTSVNSFLVIRFPLLEF